MTDEPKSRKDQILEALATMLEASPGERITTAALASKVGVSEAALYRHFPSKAKMFEGLIEFIENTVFSRINRIITEDTNPRARCGKILYLLLTFTERNPGITRLITGDALAGETQRLRSRMTQFHDRLETQMKQILRESEIRDQPMHVQQIETAANLMLSTVDGRIGQFVRSDFKRLPTTLWQEQWAILSNAIFS